MAETTEIVEQPKQTFSVMLTESLNEVKDALPVGFNLARYVQNAVALLNDNEGLRKFAQTHGTSQIKMGLMKGAYLGLDAMSKECYLIPYGSSLQFMPSYIGCEKLVIKYSVRPVKNIYAKVVREGDAFEEKIVEGQPTIDFKPKPFNDGKIIGAFAVCLFKDGGMIYDTMSLKSIEQTRKASKMSGGATWTNYYEEMAKKTVLHRLCKHIQIDFDNPKQYEYFNEDNQAVFEEPKPKRASLNDVLDGEVADEV